MKYDAIIIGTGQAGPPLAGKLAGNGYKTAIIEKDQYGGTCVNVGCTPTKAYVASARRAWAAKNSSNLGVSIDGKVKIDLKTIKKRKDEIVEESRAGLTDFLENTENLTVYNGHAKFTDNKTVEVNGKELEADKIFINTGAKPRIPDGFKDMDYLTNRSILELEEIPEHLVIVGGGYIGLEFGQMFRRFGSEVTIIEQGNQVLSQEDDEFCEAISDIIKNEGINVRFNAECINGSNTDDGVVVDLDCEEDDNQLKGSHVLLAAGRIPATDNLGLDQTAIATDEHGYITVSDRLETSVSNVFALGDCNGEGAFTHTAYNDYQIVSSLLFEKGNRTLRDRHTCYACFIDPPLARVGLNETQVRNKGIDAQVATRPMSRVARAKEKGETQGLLKLIVETNTAQILGAAFLGTGADEYIHTIIDMMYAGAPYTTIRDAVHIHPTVSELIPTMLEELEPLK
ncbi:MAG: FAD-containing oxidoreductase [Balneolaceae bacterium]|nr:FAD-containing oxidoreductase [Balneolaceae bacterium]